jgi:inner membrane protein
MLLPTHLIAGQTAFLALSIATGHAPTPAELWASMAAACIPDIDKRNGYVGRWVWPLAEWLEYRWGHRTVTHSLLLQAVVGGGLYPFLPFGFWLAFVTGWVSHSWLDMMTPSGVCWFWPSKVRCIFPGNADLRITETSWAELVFAVVIGALAFPLAYWAGQGTGTTGLIRDALGNIVSARQEYDSAKGNNAWTLTVEGRDNRTFAAVSGTYPVRGPWQEGGFLLDGETGPVTVCLSEGCDWHPERAVLRPAGAEAITVLNLAPKATTGPALAARLRSLEQAGRVYLLGQVETRAGQPKAPTLTGSETRLELHYATPADLAGIGAILSGEITVQVRHPPGVPIPEIGPEPAPVGRHPLLERWIKPGL